MTNPILVEMSRSTLVESVHRGAYIACDAQGGIVRQAGDVERAIFPRSAIKAMQAIYLMESGAVSNYEFGDKEIALACSSHSGEEAHIELARNMLHRAGLTCDDLECGCHWSTQTKVAISQARLVSEPTALHNNCSGKHVGFLCAANHLGQKTYGYIKKDHAVQKEIAAIVGDMTGAPMSDELCGVDGCSIPTYAMSLKAMAKGFAKMATGEGLSAPRAKASSHIVEACMNQPFFVAGTDRACTRLMAIAPKRIFVKTGAEGVYCGALPELGLGLALKIDDGGTRAAETAIAALCAELMGAEDPAYEQLKSFSNRTLYNWNKIQVGQFNTIL